MSTSAAPPPPAPGYFQPTGYGVSGTIVTQPVMMPIVNFREIPIQCSCQFCRSNIVTSTKYETGTLTWVACFIIACAGCLLGCCFIPFCVNACKDVTHTCPSCHRQVGKYNRM